MNIEEAFELGLEFAALCREEQKILNEPHQSSKERLDTISSRKYEIVNVVYEEELKKVRDEILEEILKT